MNPRKLIGAIALGSLLLLGLSSRYIERFDQDEWDPLWKLAYVLAMCIAIFAAFYDRKNFPEKTWDYNPKRGILYFFLGWIIFPIMIGVEAIIGTEFTLSQMALSTLALSALVGVFGTFTENVGV